MFVERVPMQPLFPLEVKKKLSDIVSTNPVLPLANGRNHETQAGKADIDVVVTNHEINDYQRTRGITTNCNYVVLFPYYSLSSQ